MIWNLEDNAGVKKAFPPQQYNSVYYLYDPYADHSHSLYVLQGVASTPRKELLVVESDDEEEEEEGEGEEGDQAWGDDDDIQEEEQSDDDHV